VGPSPAALVRAAVEALEGQFFEPLAVPDLLRDAWEGAAAALTRAGTAAVPPAPAYPADLPGAYALHAETFPALERSAAAGLGAEALAVAALEELLARRRDGHTFLHTPRMLERARAAGESPPPSGWC
jgi:hypothetical protein